MYTTLVDVATLQSHLHDPRWVCVDCRFELQNPKAGRLAYLQAHIPAARYADLDTDLASAPTATSGRHPLPDPRSLADKLGQWGIDRHTQVIVYDAGNSAIAARLWWLLRWLGHASVAVLDGGWHAWQGAGGSIEHTLPVQTPRYFIPQVQADMATDVTVLQRGLATAALYLLDARSPARYAGETEPLDAVAGHVPGAINYPFEANLNAQGRFLPVEQLRARFMPLASTPEQVVHMCGSGVSACQNLLAMAIAGLHGSRLYPGSWSEWIRDPTRNVKKGYEP
ncbi:MAG: sulfurtransferase [Gammaproteobacteria bacterium]|nr:sulfurtransferase [Gammaproteobacteria bacterium]